MKRETRAMTQARYVGRFAPSPTGPLHVGSLIAAVASYLDARAHGGAWHVRIEDIDETRCKAEYAEDIIQTLRAYGLHWDGEVLVQSKRKLRYAEALARLIATDSAYTCICSRREIADSAVSGIDGPVYPGTCASARHARADGALRFRVGNESITFADSIQGQQSQQLARDVGDFVVKRRDGLFAYQLAVVVDDFDTGVTHIVRGADLLDSTTRQIALQRALGFPTPQYLHVPVATNSSGEKLSKQTMAPAVDIGPTEAAATLRRVLAFLGQDRIDFDNKSPHGLLKSAISRWSRSKIPHERARVLN
jgi:glutamyl-Q tRNA(Asp) synthetase